MYFALTVRNLSDRKDLLDLLLGYVVASTPTHHKQPAMNDAVSQRETEIRPAAALSLGRLVVGEPTLLLPFLLKALNEAVSTPQSPSSTEMTRSGGHQLICYYLLQALREVSYSTICV